MIKVITGIRRAGKSYLLFNLFYDYLINNNIDQNHTIKFAFDSQEYLDLIDEDLIDLSIATKKVDSRKFNNYRKINNKQLL